MSEFHGGFFLHRVDAGLQQPVIEATRSYFFQKKLPIEQHHLTFATQRGCPVMHVAVRGGDAEDRGYFVWHSENAALGGLIARAIEQPVWAYCYENQTGYEMVWRFSKDGTGGRASSADHGRLHEQLGLGDTDSDWEYLKSRLPLGRLAAQLNVHRELLDKGLAYFTAACTVPLDGRADPEALAHYLAGPLAVMREPPNPSGSKVVEVYLLAPVAEEAARLADQLELPVGTLLWAAWETAKARLHKDTKEVDRFGNPTGSMRTPKARPPEEISVPAKAEEPSPLPASTERVKLTVMLPKHVLNEAQALADCADRSSNWALQQAWLRARGRLMAAERR
jgi:hypothetical protein